ncbi:beta strand repeat-containing protein, partial [Nostoc sp.]
MSSLLNNILWLNSHKAYSSNNSVKAGAAGGIAVSPALALTIVSNETLAIVGSGDTLIVDSIDAQATHTGKSSAIADAAAAGDKVGIGGALGLNFVDDKTIATTKRNITATTGGVAFGAFAYASSEANAKAGAAGADPEASKAEGQNTAEDQANGQLDSVDDPDAAKHKEQLAGKAETNDGSVSIAAGLAVNVANSSTQASLADGIVINAAGEFKLATSNETDASAIADGTMVGAAPQVGIGVAVALNIVNATNEATIGQSLDGNANVTAQGITLEAKMSDPNLGGDGISDFTAEATSGAGAKSVGVAGSFALNLIGANPSIASINSGAIVDAGGGDVTLVAENNTKSITKAEAAQTAAEDGAPSVGVGASFALDIEHNRAEASLADNVTLLNAGQLTLNATSNTTSETSVQAGSAGKISVSPAVALTIVSNDTIATIGTGGELIVGSLEAIAQHSGNTTTTADASAAGESVGIGATLALNIVDDTTIATTQRNITATTGGVAFEAHAFAATGATATASSAGAAPAEEEAAPTGETTSGTTTPAKSAPPKTAEEQIGTQLDGASKNDPDSAQYKDDVNGKAKSNSDGAVSIAAALSLNLARSTTAATLSDNLVINAAGEFKLNASNETDGSAVADGSAVDGSNQIGIGAAVALNIVKASNQATIGTGAQVTANGITLEAQMSDESLNGDGVSNFTAESTSGAGAENVGVSGSFALNFVNNSNEAVIKSGAIVDAGSGDITLVAASNEIDDVKATSEATSGNVGVGASIGLNLLLSNPVRAEIEDSVTLSGSGALTLNAKSDRIVTTTVEAGSSGGTAVSPAVAVAIINNDTTARLGAGTGTLNLSGDVNIKAEHTGAVLTSGDATAAGEKVAVGAIVAVNVSTDNTTATVMRDLTTSGGNVVIESQSALSSSAKVLASASGNKQEGRNADDEAKAQSGQSTLPSAQDSVNSSNNSANSASSDPSGNSASGGTSGAGVGVAAAVGVNWQKATNKAVIGDNIRIITEGGAVTVSAQSQTNATARAIGTSLSSKAKANVSAAVGLNIADVNNIASVGSQAIINAQSSEGQQGDI